MGERKNSRNLERWKVILEYDKKITRKERIKKKRKKHLYIMRKEKEKK